MAEPTGPFPDFCQQDNLYGVFFIAELVVLVLLISPRGLAGFDLRELGLLSVYAQLIALSAAAILCGLRPRFERLPVLGAFGLALLLILLVTALATYAGVWLDRILDLGVVEAEVATGRLLAGNLAVVSLVAAAALRYFHVQHQWRRNVEARARAQTQALQARIRPHFLFNALNTIAMLTRKDPATAERAVEDLSDLFRASLVEEQAAWTLADEQELCQRYADIEQLRLGDRLAFDWALDSLPGATPLPRLVLQPLVENAVLHGIQRLTGGGVVRIRGGLDDDRRHAWLEVENPRPPRPDPRNRGSGLALANIRDRLMLRYGRRATLITRAEPERFVARLHWPLQGD